MPCVTKSKNKKGGKVQHVMSSYQKFVSENWDYAKGNDWKTKIKHLAMMWNQYKNKVGK